MSNNITISLPGGQSLYCVPTKIRPFGINEIIGSINGSGQHYDLSFETSNPTINGKVEEGTKNYSVPIVFIEEPAPYTLVPGGWLPMPFAMPNKFLVDRNVVTHLKAIRNETTRPDIAAIAWWTQFFKDGTAIFNALPYAWESNTRQSPTFDEFVSQAKEGTTVLKNALPHCQVFEYSNEKLDSIYKLLTRFQSRSKDETTFLINVCSLLADKIAVGNEFPILEKIVLAAKSTNVHPISLPFLAALSCLYEDNTGESFSIGRKLLKPKKCYTKQTAYNAISDVRHMEIAAVGQGYIESNAFHLVTCDKALAAFWCATLPIWEKDQNGNFEISYHLDKALMPRLSQEEFERTIAYIKSEVQP